MYMSGLNGPMRSKRTLTALDGGGLDTWVNSMLTWNSIGQAFMSMEATILQGSFFAFLAFIKSSHYDVLIITNKIFMCLCTG
jgi:hypothetical protein